MEKQNLAVLCKVFYIILTILPFVTTDCTNRACFPPSPDLVVSSAERSVTANSTCGDPPSLTFFLLTDTEELCNASDPNLAHTSEYLHDFNTLIAGSMYLHPVLRTWWQSESSQQNVALTLSLGDTFLFQSTRLVFRSLRPKSLIIEKSEDSGQTWVPLRYYARSCLQSFPGVTFLASDAFDENSNIVSGCMQRYYYGDTATFDDTEDLQEVLFNPVSELGERFYEKQVLDYFQFTGLRVLLVEPGSGDSGRDYFAVADWSVTGHCLCYGHAEECIGQDESGCNCQHNTMGKFCDECLPLFNNRPWAAAYLENANECEDCGCNGRADSCTYDEVKGYGVCDNCTENTTGDKCDHCIENFYMNPGNISDSTACIACHCSEAGSVPGSICNGTDGQCTCKANVQGRDCDECRDSFYNLLGTNSQGCQMCDCDPRGTEGSPNFCNKTTGQCICKANVDGTRCNTCKRGFFNLNLTNPEGCTPCDCDGGGALNNTCNRVTGVCDCKMNIKGRSCDVVESGFYIPLLDAIRIEAEFVQSSLDFSYVLEERASGSTGKGLLTIPPSSYIAYPSFTVPRTQRYELVTRYEAPSPSVDNLLTLFSLDNLEVYSCAGFENVTNTTDILFNLNQMDTLGSVRVGNICLAADVGYQPMFLSGDSSGDPIAIDSFVFLPVLEDLPLYQQSTTQRSSIQDCWEASMEANNLLRENGTCSHIEFSLMSELFNGAVACSCDVSGSLNSSVCEPLGGQCQCLPGLSGQDCSYCAAYHYGFQPGIGCQDCGCDPLGSVHLNCNQTTGTCECKVNVTGDKCEECIPEHYGHMSGNGCSECECDPEYSLHNQCNDTGHCDCKPGIGGISCTACLPGYFNLTMDGCELCLCNLLGSQDQTCSDEGQCNCLEAATGLKCDSCPKDTFAFGSYSERGCLNCICSNHTSNCTMATDWYLYTIESSWSLFAFEVVPEWTGSTLFGDTVLLNTRPILDVINPRFILELEDPGTEVDLFFVSPEVYQGDLRTAYGQMLHFTLSQTTTDNQTVSPSGDVYIYGLSSSEPLVTSLPSSPGLQETTYSIKLHENYWKIGNLSGENPDTLHMIQILSGVHEIWIRAKFTEIPGQSVFLHEVRLDLASDDRSISSNTPADFVEDCFCPPEYTGQFCELCSLGYRRHDPDLGAFSECIPCDCNGHSDEPCDPFTGTCANCSHNTAGDFCEICIDGYYGNATVGTDEDCQPCLCPGPPGTNSFADVCDDQAVCIGCREGHGGLYCEYCLPGHFGVPTDIRNNLGRCDPCFCNLSPPECNSTTGHCTNCMGNTGGPSCGECEFGYYGDISDCMACDCNMTGSYGNCTNEGVCECLPNVNGTKCTECIPDTWGFDSGDGCTPCDCHPVGTVEGQSQCDLDTGQCQCKPLVTGQKCDQCIRGFWNVNEECLPCDCNLNGTNDATCIDGVCSCNQVTGQCSCALPTIAGRTCDRCGRLNEGATGVEEVFVGLFPNCQPCPECFHNWRSILNENINILDGFGFVLQELLSNYENVSLESVDSQLEAMRAELAVVKVALEAGLTQADNRDAIQSQFQQVIEEVSALNLQLRLVRSSQTELSAAIMELGDFDGSVTIVGTAMMVSSDEISQRSEESRNTLETIYREANNSWYQIQMLYSMSVEAKARTQDLIGEVKSLKEDIDRSTQQRTDTLNAIEDQDKIREREENTQRIQEINSIHQQFVAEAIVKEVEAAGDLAQQVEGASRVILQVAEVELNEARELSEEGNMARANVTRVQQVAISAQSRSQSYKDVALSVLTNVASAYTDLLTVLSSLDESGEAISNASFLAEQIQQFTVRPFTDMATIVGQINETQIPDVGIDELLRDGEQQLSRAEGVLNATKEAYHEASAVKGLVNTIEYNLEEGRRVKLKAEEGLSGLMENSSNIDMITTEVQERANGEVTSSTVLLDDISVLIELSRSHEQCFRDNVLIGQLATEKNQNSYARLEESDIVLSSALSQKNQLDEEVSAKSQIVLNDALDIEEFSDSVSTTEQRMMNIQQQQNLDDLISLYQAQRIEMERLLRNLQQMETDLDQILANLDGTSGDSLQCNGN
ncbi:Laminin subunit alpha [Holothuria leucospilota]|uniref:Laminin subunit alpha n=1 Tax=Holothuria leucospilota TaxID=206669 RepID=A0A9Q1C588_HOLLE|nr:Laminin subunit alpha [Holothuria leucospilota]